MKKSAFRYLVVGLVAAVVAAAVHWQATGGTELVMGEYIAKSSAESQRGRHLHRLVSTNSAIVPGRMISGCKATQLRDGSHPLHQLKFVPDEP